MPIEVTRSRRSLSPDELALIRHWVDVYERPIFRRILFVCALMTSVLMSLTFLASRGHPGVIAAFWIFFGVLLFAWTYVSIRDEHRTKLSVIWQVEIGGKPAVMDVLEYGRSKEDVEQMLAAKRDPFPPEPGDQLIITRAQGDLESIEFVVGKHRVYLNALVAASHST